jgi:hypothetical protein
MADAIMARCCEFPAIASAWILEALRDKEPSHLCITNIDKGSDVVGDYTERSLRSRPHFFCPDRI